MPKKKLIRTEEEKIQAKLDRYYKKNKKRKPYPEKKKFEPKIILRKDK